MEVALAVGDAFLSAFLLAAFNRIASSRKFLDFFQAKEVIEFDEETLQKLEITLNAISVVLEDAEDKQAKSPAVRRWLDNLKHSVNHTDDLLDELNTECLRLKLDYELQHEQREVDLKLSLKPAVIEELMPNLKKVTERLEYFVNQIHGLGLEKFDRKEKYPYRPPTSSLVDKSQVFGRDEEKENLIQTVLSNEGDSNVSVIAITGMGGVGKTTLAQLVYNDDRVKKKFSTRAWACVSEEYDDLRVTKALLACFSEKYNDLRVTQLLPGEAVVDDTHDVNRLQIKLRYKLEGKCFLIILDDVWNENYNDWSSLKTLLNYGSRGSKIIVTARIEKVALLMQNEAFHHLQPIPEDHSWSLFKSQAFDTGDHTSLQWQEFQKIGKEIVKKCKGLPLAIKTTAAALRPERDIDVWHEFLRSKDWVAEGDILPSLSLSYKHLPSHLKCCFAFCALFPKNVPFNKDEVVLLWMANDLVKPSTRKVGCIYFEELIIRSFFELVNGKKYIMHDLVNDLACSVAKKFCIRLEDYQAHHQSIQRQNELPPQVLHFSYLSTYDETSERFRGLAQAENLRTFLPIHQDQEGHSLTTLFFSYILPKFQRLRVLNLSHYGILMVPDSIGDLKHLRFLNLASTNIKQLPNAICKCLNLETLILAYCFRLVELPEDMRLLINLQHLDVRGVLDRLVEEMVTWYKDIQNISIVIDRIRGSVLEQLDKLQLCHSLNTIAECSQDELTKFARLQPRTNTKQLSITGYKGTRFSYWLEDSAFSNMESLFLEDCKNCFALPPLGQLTGLKKLEISGMDGITVIGEEFYGNASTSRPFQALQELKFSRMAKWEIWNTHSDIDFSSLKSFSITNCPKLVSHLPCGDSSEPIPLLSFSNLENVYIDKWKGLNLFKLPNGYHQTLASLHALEISHCSNIWSFPEGGLPAPNLKKLWVTNCKKMRSLPARMHTQLPLLCSLSIWACPEIEGFPEGGLPSSLETLSIRYCKKMRSCQTNWDLQRLLFLTHVSFWGFDNTLFPEERLLPTSLQSLNIRDFCNLESLNDNGLQSLCSLRSLDIFDCPNMAQRCELLESFPEGLAFSLVTLRIEKYNNMKCINWGLQRLRSLTHIYLDQFDDTLFPEKGLLPGSLQLLEIDNFYNLESLNEKALQHLSSLRSLYIRSCPNLKYLPEKLSSSLSEISIWTCDVLESFPEGLASSLSKLTIRECPQLTPRMERDGGEDWLKVSHIPCIDIDWEIIS